MASNYQIRTLTQDDLGQMHRTFSEAFSDYPIPYNLSLDQFTRKMTNKVRVSFDHSIGAFSNEKLVAFIFHSINQYEGKLSAYNAGTGVIPGHRGRGLSVQLYKEVIPYLVNYGIFSCVLEVLEINPHAMDVYRQLGFQTTKKFACFQLKDRKRQKATRYEIKPAEKPDLKTYQGISK